MPQHAQRACATLSCLLLVLSCWLPTVAVPHAAASTLEQGPDAHRVFAAASPIVLM